MKRWPVLAFRWRLDRRVVRPLAIYGAVLIAMLAALSGSPLTRNAATGLTMPVLSDGPKVPLPIIRDIVSSGLPTIGLTRAGEHRPPILSTAQVGSWLLAGIAGVPTGDPLTWLSSGMPLLMARPSRGGVQHGTWNALRQWSPKPPKAVSEGSVTEWGTNPLLAIYSTNTHDSFDAWLPKGTTLPISSNPQTNMTALGRVLGEDLWQEGISVALSRTVNDAEGQIGAYVHSQPVAEALLQNYPEVRLLIDLDRGSSGLAARELGGRTFAPIVVVVGSDVMLPYPNWRTNLALGTALVRTLNEIRPGIASLHRSADRLNQQISPVSLTVRVGTAASPLAAEERSLAVLASGMAQQVSLAP